MASLSTGTGTRGCSLTREPGRRGSSLAKETEEPDIPSYRSRMRRQSLFDEDDLLTSKPIKKFSLDNTNYEPIKSSDLRDKLRNISDDYNKTPAWQPRKNYQKSEISFKTEYGPRGDPIIKREELTYSIPDSTKKSYRKSSVVETSSYDSKPPLNLRTRRSSIGSGNDFSSSISSVRTSTYNDASSGLPPRPSKYGITSCDDDKTSKFVSASQFRDARKLKESDDLTENIQKMVNKMKRHHLDDASADVRSVSRTLRATSVDPFEDDGARSRCRQRARLNQFTYGVGKY